jgi:hypothetical protein
MNLWRWCEFLVYCLVLNALGAIQEQLPKSLGSRIVCAGAFGIIFCHRVAPIRELAPTALALRYQPASAVTMR